MNSITFKTTLLKGDTGAGIDKTIPEDGVIYYDGDSAPEGYTETTDPTGGGGSSYTETVLYQDSTGVQTGNITLTADFTNYDVLYFYMSATDEYTEVWIKAIPVTFLSDWSIDAIDVSTYSATAHRGSVRASNETTIYVNMRNAVDKVYRILGVKY